MSKKRRLMWHLVDTLVPIAAMTLFVISFLSLLVPSATQAGEQQPTSIVCQGNVSVIFFYNLSTAAFANEACTPNVPDLVDVASNCDDVDAQSFVDDATAGTVLSIAEGEGVYIPNVTKFIRAPEYTVRLVLRVDAMTGWSRIMNLNHGSEHGLYFNGAGEVEWYPDGTSNELASCVDDPNGILSSNGFTCASVLAALGTCDFDMSQYGFSVGVMLRHICPVECADCIATSVNPLRLPFGEWHSLTITTSSNGSSHAYLDGGSKVSWEPLDSWETSAAIISDEMLFFNDNNPWQCFAGGEHVALLLKSIMVLERQLTDEEVATLERLDPVPLPSITCVDDASSWLAASGWTCAMVAQFGCGMDLHELSGGITEGTLVSTLCPVTCNRCSIPRPGHPSARCVDDPNGVLAGVHQPVIYSPCVFSTGDGQGETEISVGSAPTREECAALVQAQHPSANGATYSNTGGTDCYAEFGMTGQDANAGWQTCMYSSESFGATCSEIVSFGCDTDLHNIHASFTVGTLIASLCPSSCDSCERDTVSLPTVFCLDDPDGILMRSALRCDTMVSTFGCSVNIRDLHTALENDLLVAELCPSSCGQCPSTRRCEGHQWRCGEFSTGDGQGEAEISVGSAPTREECAALVQAQHPSANGATYSNTGGTDCYAEFGMTGQDANAGWQTCMYSMISCDDEISCVFTVGDGIGDSETMAGITPTAEECTALIYSDFPAANGATYNNLGSGECYAEFGMASQNSNPTWQTCLFITPVACFFSVGDGTGGSESFAGLTSGPQECAGLVRAAYPLANGATYSSDTEQCYAEFGMTDQDDTSTNWQTCAFSRTHSCEFFTGDGTGGDETLAGNTASKEECVALVGLTFPMANGATYSSTAGGDECYAEFGMTGTTTEDDHWHADWQTCFFETRLPSCGRNVPVMHYDMGSGSFAAVAGCAENIPDLVDVRSTCSPGSLDPQEFVNDPIAGTVLSITEGAGVYIPNIRDFVPSLADTEYTVRIVVRISSNQLSGFRRLFNFNHGEDRGLYLNGNRFYLWQGYAHMNTGGGDGDGSPEYPADSWHSITATTRPNGPFHVYLDGASKTTWSEQPSWLAESSISSDELLFFNDNSPQECSVGGTNEQMELLLKSITVYDVQLNDEDVANLETSFPVPTATTSECVDDSDGLLAVRGIDCVSAAQHSLCAFSAGDGTGGSETLAGNTSSREECASLVAASFPQANGATFSATGGDECYAEFGMSGRTTEADSWHDDWQTCFFVSGCDDSSTRVETTVDLPVGTSLMMVCSAACGVCESTGMNSACKDDPAGVLVDTSCAELLALVEFNCTFSAADLDNPLCPSCADRVSQAASIREICPLTCGQCNAACLDEPLTEANATCEQLVSVGCDVDIHTIDESITTNATVADMCPSSCGNCPIQQEYYAVFYTEPDPSDTSMTLVGDAVVDATGLHIDGEGDCVQIANVDYASDASFTISLWIQKDECNRFAATPECIFAPGDGAADSEMLVGNVGSPSECVKVVQSTFPTANGATYSNDGGSACYAEFGMYGRDYTTAWQSCMLTSGGEYLFSHVETPEMDFSPDSLFPGSQAFNRSDDGVHILIGCEEHVAPWAGVSTTGAALESGSFMRLIMTESSELSGLVDLPLHAVGEFSTFAFRWIHVVLSVSPHTVACAVNGITAPDFSFGVHVSSGLQERLPIYVSPIHNALWPRPSQLRQPFTAFELNSAITIGGRADLSVGHHFSGTIASVAIYSTTLDSGMVVEAYLASKDLLPDCAGTQGGSLVKDGCGVCNGNGLADDCGICDEDILNDCVPALPYSGLATTISACANTNSSWCYVRMDLELPQMATVPVDARSRGLFDVVVRSQLSSLFDIVPSRIVDLQLLPLAFFAARGVVCEYALGDGLTNGGQNEVRAGNTPTKEACAELVAAEYPAANGATYSAAGGTDCYAEFGMNSINQNSNWQTCYLSVHNPTIPECPSISFHALAWGSEATWTVDTDICTTTGGNAEAGSACMFPFEYSGVQWNMCTDVDHDQPWCFTHGGSWGNCVCEMTTACAGGPYSSSALPETVPIDECCLPPGEYKLSCLDSWGDGWHGSSVTIGGVQFCENFHFGTSMEQRFVVSNRPVEANIPPSSGAQLSFGVAASVTGEVMSSARMYNALSAQEGVAIAGYTVRDHTLASVPVCIDDPDGWLEQGLVHWYIKDCEWIMQFLVDDCNVDVHAAGYTRLPEGTLLADLCPLSCDACDRYAERMSDTCSKCPHQAACGHRDGDCKFVYHDVPLPWLEAEKQCSATGGHLMTVFSETQELLSSVLHNKVWIGYNDREEESSWRWVDPTRRAPPNLFTADFPVYVQPGSSLVALPALEDASGRDCGLLYRAPDEVDPSSIICDWALGDGTGGTERFLGHADTKQACIELVLASAPTANGVTYPSDDNGGTACYAEFEMSSQNLNRFFQSCKLRLNPNANGTRVSWADISCDELHPYICEVCEEHDSPSSGVCPERQPCHDDPLRFLRLAMGAPYEDASHGWLGHSNVLGTHGGECVFVEGNSLGGTQQQLPGVSTREECVDLVSATLPSANGVTYSNDGQSDCFANFKVTGRRPSLGRWQSCIFQQTSTHDCASILSLQGVSCSSNLASWYPKSPDQLLIADICPETCMQQCEDCSGPECIPCDWIVAHGQCNLDGRCYPEPAAPQCAEHRDRYGLQDLKKTPMKWMAEQAACTGCASSSVTMNLVDGGSESSWIIEDAQGEVVCSGGVYTDATQNIHAEGCCLANLAYTLSCIDTAGNGWHGSFLDIGGDTFCANFTNGHVHKEQIDLRAANICLDNDDNLEGSVTCAAVAMACACDTVRGAADACKLSCPAGGNPLNPRCMCTDDESWVQRQFEDSEKTCANLAATGWCNRDTAPPSVLLNYILPEINDRCCKSCSLVSSSTYDSDSDAASCPADEDAAALYERFKIDVGIDAVAGAAEMRLQTDAGCSPEICGDTLNHIYGHIHERQEWGLPLQPMANVCPLELQECLDTESCEEALREALSGNTRECSSVCVDLPDKFSNCCPTGSPGGSLTCGHDPVALYEDPDLIPSFLQSAECPVSCGLCMRRGVCMDDPWDFFKGWGARGSPGEGISRGPDAWRCEHLQTVGVSFPNDCNVVITDALPRSSVYNTFLAQPGQSVLTISDLCPRQCNACTCEDGWELDATGQCARLGHPRYKLSRLLGCLLTHDVLRWLPDEGYIPGLRSTSDSVAADRMPCRRTCAACDLDTACQSLLLDPIQTWSAKHSLLWLLDKTTVASLPMITAFMEKSLDGRILGGLVGPNEVLATHTLAESDIPLASVKPLLQALETFAYPTELERAPARQSCSRLDKPIAVNLDMTVIDLYSVDDVAMEFEVSIAVELAWDDDRVRYIPSSTKGELQACEYPCFSLATNVVPEGSVPPEEAEKCCDRMWQPRLSYTNAKTLTAVEDMHIVWHQDRAKMTTTIRGRFKSTMEFQTFPFDEQSLEIHVLLNTITADAGIQLSNIRLLDRLYEQGPAGWELAPIAEAVGQSTSTTIAADENAVVYSTATITLQVQRLHSHFVDNYMTSMVLLCSLSWLAFSLKANYIEARLASTITLLLAMMALSQVITPSLPQSERTPAHVLMFQTNLLIVFVGVESIFVWALSSEHHVTKEGPDADEWPDPSVAQFGQPRDGLVPRSEPPQMTSGNTKPLRSQTAAVASVHDHCRDCASFKQKLNLGEMIDLVSSIVFPISYMMLIKIMFPQISTGEFVLLFPACFSVAVVLAQLVMESSTIYTARWLRDCVPSKMNSTPTQYMAGAGHSAPPPADEEADMPGNHMMTSINPMSAPFDDGSNESTSPSRSE